MFVCYIDRDGKKINWTDLMSRLFAVTPREILNWAVISSEKNWLQPDVSISMLWLPSEELILIIKKGKKYIYLQIP